MFTRSQTACALLALALSPAVLAASDADLQALRGEVAQMKQTYEARIAALEKRLAAAEATAGEASQRASAAAPAAAPAANANAFNPAVSFILSGLYSNLSQDPANYRISGFQLPNGVRDEIKPQRGFSLAESELGIYANVDPYFYGGFNLAVHPDDTVSAEEAFIQTTALPHGLTVKGGRFFSGIGYLNEQHSHVWDFVDAPLAYQAFLGGQYGNDGVQLRWLAPTETYLELGAEVGRGQNFPGTERDKNGAGSSALYAHVGGDAGVSNSWRAGVSLLKTSPQDRQWDATDLFGNTVSNAFSGDSRLWIVDGVWKWAPNGDATYRNFKLQGEYFSRHEDGTVVYDTAGANLPGHYDATQSGWYLQGVYQWAPYWRAGLRTEQLDPGSVSYGSNDANLARSGFKPARHSLMVDYNPSEFSRIRLQFSQDKSREGVTDNQAFLQYQMSLGAHGAHQF
jgi:hypothetical protein